MSEEPQARPQSRFLLQTKRPPKPAAFAGVGMASLFCRLLARRVERAGIVDFGDLVIAEAEHLS
jgi:hypothetical protein